MATTTQHLGLSALAIDRMSGPELLRLGIVVPEGGHNMRVPPTPAEEIETAMMARPCRAEIPGTIYVLQALPILPVKIGFTRARALRHRVTSIQTGVPYPLKVIARAKGLPAHEREVHAVLASDRLSGEWFDWTPRVQAFVQAMRRDLKAALSSL